MWDTTTVVRIMDDVRKWANPTIKARLQRMEWRIIKLCDLAEQLRKERDEVLTEAFGGQTEALPWLDEESIDPQRLMTAIVSDMYALLYQTDAETGSVPLNTSASNEIGFLIFAFKDTPEDEMGPMG